MNPTEHLGSYYTITEPLVQDDLRAEFHADYMQLGEADKQRVVYYIEELIAARSEHREPRAFVH